MPDNESTEIDTAAIIEGVRRLNAEVERLRAEIERTNAALVAELLAAIADLRQDRDHWRELAQRRAERSKQSGAHPVWTHRLGRST